LIADDDIGRAQDPQIGSDLSGVCKGMRLHVPRLGCRRKHQAVIGIPIDDNNTFTGKPSGRFCRINASGSGICLRANEKVEGCPLSFATEHSDNPAHVLNQLLTDRESQTGTSVLAGGISMRLEKWLK